MINYITGNLMDANNMAIVNTVNTVGVMGKGIALQFKEKYPSNYKVYYKACKTGRIDIGKLLVFKDQSLSGEKIIINFPTKKDWRHKSKYEYIKEGLKDLVIIIKEFNITNIAIPPLGCGNGGLDWNIVKIMMEEYLSPLSSVDIYIYQPNSSVKNLLQKEKTNLTAKLTPARALLLYAMFYYESLGEMSSLFVANKLAYFMKRLKMQDFDRLDFKPHHYGPFAVGVEHMLYYLNGKYIKGLEQKDAKAFEQLFLQYNTRNEVSAYVRMNLKPEQINKLKKLISLISGFESSVLLEILSSVDYVGCKFPEYDLDQVNNAIQV